MTRRCKGGMRARIISESNAGKIVVVVRRYMGERINGAAWPKAMFPWVVTSLGAPLRSFRIATDEELPLAMTIVVDDPDLEPLRDDDEPESEHETEDPALEVHRLRTCHPS